MYLICIYVISNEKKQILELFNMKLSKIIDENSICKKNYDDPLGYFCMGLFFFTCPYGQVTNKFHLSNGRFHLSRTIGKTLLSRPAFGQAVSEKRFLKINQPETRIAYGSHVC